MLKLKEYLLLMGGGQLACARKVKKHKALTVIVAEALHFSLRCRYIIRYVNVMRAFITITGIMCTITI